MKISDIVLENRKYNLVGTCVNSFDEDTMEYLFSKLDTIEDLARIDDNEIQAVFDGNGENLITDAQKYVRDIPKLDDDAVMVYSNEHDVYVIYNPDEDIHYIYENASSICRYISEAWSEDDPIGSLPDPIEDWGNIAEAKLIRRYSEVKAAPKITVSEAEMLISADVNLLDDIFLYRYDNTPIPQGSLNKIVSIMKRIMPVDKTFYRGVEYEDYDNKHIMTIQSWATSVKVAKYFGDIIYQTMGSVKGIELSNLFYWNGLLHGESSGFGDGGMGEWLLLPPDKKLLDE